MKIKIYNTSWTVYALIIGSISIAIFKNTSIFLIIDLLVTTYYATLALINTGEARRNYSLLMILTSIIAPFQYLVYITILLATLLNKKSRGSKRDYLILLPILLISTITNKVYVSGILLSIFYWFPEICMMALISDNKFNKKSSYLDNRIVFFCKSLIFIEGIPIISQFLQSGNFVDLDRVSGTFGYLRGESMTILMYSIGIYFFGLWNEFKKREFVFYFLTSIALGTLDGCFTITIFFLSTMLVVALISNKIKLRYKIMLVVGALFIFELLIVTNSEWAVKDLFNMTDQTYLLSRVEKISAYKVTFVSEKIYNKIFGHGIGNYSSRAALTMTGVYTDWYGNLGFPIHMSDYTRRYIYPWLIKAPYNGGMLSAPFSEVITIFGELGILGLIYFIYKIVLIWRDGNKYQRIQLIFIILLCLYGNYLEMGVDVSIFLFTYIILNGIIKKA